MKPQSSPLAGLTARENEVLLLLKNGCLYKEIADILHVKIDTIKKHTKNIYQKLGVRNRTEAVNVLLRA